VVLFTSSRKLFSYLLTSSLNISKVTIIIISLVGLKSNILRRAKEYNISYNIYKKTRIFENFTLVSIKLIINSSFISLV
jgi:hypothetical protein